MKTLTLAIACALVGLKRWSTTAAVFLDSLLPLIAFSAFLRSKGMPLLLMSVLVKGGAVSDAGPLARAIHVIVTNIRANLRYDRISLAVLLVVVLLLALRSTTRLSRCCYGGAVALGLLQLIVGRFGWFHRYEVCAVAFLTIVALSEMPQVRFRYVVLGLALVDAVFILATLMTPSASYGIYLQQYEMHRFTRDFYGGNSFAVNDLGLVSFKRRPGTYVLDVYGLASVEAARQQVKSATWLAAITRRYNANSAILYPLWFEIPSAWAPLGQLCVTAKEHVSVGNRCVTFYSTNPDSTQSIRADIARFVPTLPSDVQYYAK